MKLTLGPHGLRMQPCERSSSGAPMMAKTPTCCRRDHLLRGGRAPPARLRLGLPPPWRAIKAVALRCHAVLLAGAQGARACLPGQTAGGLQRLRACSARATRAPRAPAASPRRGAPAASLPRARLRRLNAKCAYRPPPAAEAAAAGRRASAASRRRTRTRIEDGAARAAGGAQPGPRAEDVQPVGCPGASAAPQPRRWKAGPWERAGQAR